MDITINENVRLELTAEKHAATLFEAMDNSREHLSRFLPWVDNMRSVDDFRDYIKDCEILYRQKKEVSFVIMHNNEAVGRIGLHHLNMQNKIGAIGYWLGKNAEGKGIITNACKKLISYGFETVGLHRIEIKAAVHNLKSQAIPEKLQFKKEGILRQAEWVNGQFVDLFIYSMLQPEWADK